jgi:hypothetical protein
MPQITATVRRTQTDKGDKGEETVGLDGMALDDGSHFFRARQGARTWRATVAHAV